MIEISIPQDIRAYEPTLIGTLTTRQVVFGLAGCAIAIGGYMIEDAMGIDPLMYPVFVLLAAPAVIVGWYKPYGMTFETFIFQAYRDNYQAPENRPYKIENMWDQILKEEAGEGKTEEESGKKKAAEKAEPKKAKTPRSALPEELRSYR